MQIRENPIQIESVAGSLSSPLCYPLKRSFSKHQSKQTWEIVGFERKDNYWLQMGILCDIEKMEHVTTHHFNTMLHKKQFGVMA